MSVFSSSIPIKPATNEEIQNKCNLLVSQTITGDLGSAIALIVLAYSPRDLTLMRSNFSEKIRNLSPDYQKNLEESVSAYLEGTYQNVRLMYQQGTFSSLSEPVRKDTQRYWKMVSELCVKKEGKEAGLVFLKFLLAGFCMFVQKIPGHPVGMQFPGGDKVEMIDGIYYCPVRTKANDVKSALCPYCPALQTPDIGYLKPPVKGSRHRKQEFIKNCYDFHHFNG